MENNSTTIKDLERIMIETSEKALALIKKGKEVFNYEKLPIGESEYVREVFEKELPNYFKEHINGSEDNLYACDGTLVCRGFDRIVIGDYGAYVEFSTEKANRSQMIKMPGQEYRKTGRYANNVKFDALTVKAFRSERSKDLDEHSLLIYYQLKEVSYADYKPGMLYVSVYQLSNQRNS